MILEKAEKILAEPVCDHCLGRQFAQLLSGLGNMERGGVVRKAVAMSIDTAEPPAGIDLSNFYGFKFHSLEISKQYRKRCEVCHDIFEALDRWAGMAAKASRKYEFSTFLVGTKLSFEMIEREEALWERVGIDHCEPVKAELNREIGKLVEKKMGVRFTRNNPDVNIIVDFNARNVALEVNPLFFYGEYQKLVRGIPQTRWPSGKYKTSVEQIIAKPFMAAAAGKAHKLHGCGREDVDARCLGWRPFVLEILQPRFRNIAIKKLAKRIDRKKVKVRNVRLSGIVEVRKIKELRPPKTYRAVVVCDSAVLRSDLRKLSSLSAVRQKTPERVLHRRADRYRTRSVKSLKARPLGRKKFVLEIKGEAGLYIKELVTGDSGRTVPSVSSVLGVPCRCRELDVIAIHL